MSGYMRYPGPAKLFRNGSIPLWHRSHTAHNYKIDRYLLTKLENEKNYHNFKNNGCSSAF